ncbi:jg1577 [Pararge aegeria aegeria]|uniref:Jg1577 protein n=1 Tax=Pararge aegeria aegeria TaxID=348720 RepID=A0A8S4R8X8_9NEOP|nr:jg1577 [Pararge aegeria aegeria]
MDVRARDKDFEQLAFYFASFLDLDIESCRVTMSQNISKREKAILYQIKKKIMIMSNLSALNRVTHRMPTMGHGATSDALFTFMRNRTTPPRPRGQI